MKVGAALLTNNVEELLKQVSDASKCDFIQIDVMDSSLVTGQTVWIEGIAKALNKAKKPVELHLMISDVESKIDSFINLKPDTIIFHYEGCHNHLEVISKIKAAKIKVGIAISNKTSGTIFRKFVNDIDMALVMTVTPGKQGQTFDITATKNIPIIRHYNEKIPIEVDGGIDLHTARLCRLVGATACVSGSYLQKQNYDEEILKLFRDV